MSLVLAAAIAGVPPALAQGWKPSRSVEFVVGAGSGGGNDRTARVGKQKSRMDCGTSRT